MKTSKKFRSLMVSAAVLGMMGSSLVSTATAVMAADGDDITVTIHKKDALNYNGKIDNDGKINPVAEALPKVSGAFFEVYDVSEAFYAEYLKKGGDYEGDGQGILDLITNNINQYVNVDESGKKGGETSELDGTLTVDLPRNEANDRPAIYAIVETKPAQGMAPAQPIVFSTAVTDKTENGFDHIHLYPKNYGIDKVMLDEAGDPITDETNPAVHAVGDIVSYQVKYAIPFDIKDTPYKLIEMTDTLTGGEFVEGSLKMFDHEDQPIDGYMEGVLKPGESGNTIFTLTYDLEGENGTKMREKLAEHAGDTITVQYQVKVTGDLIADEGKNNNVVLNTNGPKLNTSQSDISKPIITGGLQGIKIGKGGENDPLKGAQFALYKLVGGKKKYASFNVNELPSPDAITWSDTLDENSRLESNGSGQIAISGLDYGKYYLEETKAPTGYVLPAEGDRTTEFEVKSGSYTVTEQFKNIVNVPEADGSLPLTGGIGVITLIVVGGTMMAITTLRKKKED